MPAIMAPLMPASKRAEELVLSISEATSWWDRRAAVAFGGSAYRGDDRWVPFLRVVRQQALDPARSPLVRGGELRLILGVAKNLGLGDEVLGTLATWGAPGWGCLGAFDCANVPELAERLFGEAENGLFERVPGLEGIRGPFSLEPLAAPGLLVDGFDRQPAGFLPYNPPYYPEIVQAQGYAPGPSYAAYELPAHAGAEGNLSPGARPSVCDGADLHAFGCRLWPVFRGQAWAAASASAPAPALADWLATLGGERRICIHREWRWATAEAFRRGFAAGAEMGGELVAACVAIPDPAAALRWCRGRLLPAGWLIYRLALRRTRRLRVFPAAFPRSWTAGQISCLYAAVSREAASRGYRQLIVAPIAGDDLSSIQALEGLGALATQRYEVYEKLF